MLGYNDLGFLSILPTLTSDGVRKVLLLETTPYIILELLGPAEDPMYPPSASLVTFTLTPALSSCATVSCLCSGFPQRLMSTGMLNWFWLPNGTTLYYVKKIYEKSLKTEIYFYKVTFLLNLFGKKGDQVINNHILTVHCMHLQVQKILLVVKKD